MNILNIWGELGRCRQLMLRHGMLSPSSKLLPQLDEDRTRLSIMSSSSYLSNASNLSLKSTASTCSKHAKDARDTPRRRVRHRDGKLLKGGIGLTTGLGWSDRLVTCHFSLGFPVFGCCARITLSDGCRWVGWADKVETVLFCRGDSVLMCRDAVLVLFLAFFD